MVTQIPNLIGGESRKAAAGEWIEKRRPIDGELHGQVPRSRAADVEAAVVSASRALARAGVVVVNAGTHGGEPHMGFGGVKQSGTGWKEAGVEALDVYSDVVYVNVVSDPSRV